MRVIVDAIPDFAFDSPPPNLAVAVAAIAARLEEEGRALQSIALNGEDLPPLGLVEHLEGQVPGADTTLEVSSAPIGTLVRDALLEMAEVLPELPVACHGIAESVSHEPWEQVQEQFGQLIQIWSALKDRQRQVLAFAGLTSESVRVSGGTLAERDTALAELLQKVNALAQAGDKAGFADAVSYDLSAAAELEVAAVKALLDAQAAD